MTKPAKVQNKVTLQAKVTLVIPTTKRRVVYTFFTKTQPSLRIPYALAIDDKVSRDFDTPLRVSGKHGKIAVEVEAGQSVKLYLGSGAHPDYRDHAVYEVTPQDHHIVVNVTEKTGKSAETDEPKNPKVDKKRLTDTYAVPLTGNIWKKVTHKYTSGEVDDLVPPDLRPEVTAGVKKIYDGLPAEKLTIHVAKKGDVPAQKLEITFENSKNCNDNMPSYDQLADGLTRVHPAGYAAMFTAALDAKVPSLIMSSMWRPCLGSIVHRVGLGLDVAYVGKILMNRAGLVKDSGNDDYVSPEEKELYEQYESDKADETAAKKDEKAKRQKRDGSNQAAKTAAKKASTTKVAAAKAKAHPATAAKAQADADAAAADSDAAHEKAAADEEVYKTAHATAQSATKKREASQKAWDDERNKNQPDLVKAFRAALISSPVTQQLFDPWEMEIKSEKGKVTDTANEQKSDNEKLHSNHLHLTVTEPKILG